MCLYQFLIAVRSDGAQLTSTDGETTRLFIFLIKIFVHKTDFFTLKYIREILFYFLF